MIEVADGTKNNPDPNFSENRKLAMSLVNHCKKPNPGDFNKDSDKCYKLWNNQVAQLLMILLVSAVIRMAQHVFRVSS